MMESLKAGDYVAATKFSDGDVNDPWVIGFVKEINGDRVIIVDGNGKVMGLAGGFRRAKRISRYRGAWAVRNMAMIGLSGYSLWPILRMSRKDMYSWEA